MVKGTYRLASRGKASIAAYVTTDAKDQWLHNIPSQNTQSTTVERGEGRFALIFYMWQDGKPHVSLYSGGAAIASVYFGTGDSVLKKGGSEAPRDREAEVKAENNERHAREGGDRVLGAEPVKAENNHSRATTPPPLRSRHASGNHRRLSRREADRRGQRSTIDDHDAWSAQQRGRQLAADREDPRRRDGQSRRLR